MAWLGESTRRTGVFDDNHHGYRGNKALTGGMMKRQMPEQQGITNYVDVKSVDEYSARVAQLGGQVKMPKTAVPGLGYFAICIDTANKWLRYLGNR